jgi:hypothetical protein
MARFYLLLAAGDPAGADQPPTERPARPGQQRVEPIISHGLEKPPELVSVVKYPLCPGCVRDPLPGITKADPMAGFHAYKLVAGVGFEPTTFGL